MNRTIVTVLILAVALATSSVASAQVQVPGAGKMAMPSKDDLLSQAKQMVTDLTSMKSSGKLTTDQAGKVDAMLPKANAMTTELAKPQVETSKLAQYAKDLGDMQKQLTALKSMVK
jgi:hypothetical protein